ncbi:TIGR03643 family protein [Parasphingorhabdus halotolerans]|uniref:TIGR03643 family protein n=1 Tax=Parasphingorhabdus halotolerans TaxID=2725558 RepID=A0A6H2DND1_9SPHN|nr:TIGR03643 family protein [Parasphingorhabdus halotolerans]QJB69465.1 TIGR03643 family protein [Parasphingorhabdus halotolerans]
MSRPVFPDNFVPSTQQEDRGTIFTSEIIAMAWADEISFDMIQALSGLREKDVIIVMRTHMRPGSFRRWRKRVNGRASKHRAKHSHGRN